MGYLNTQLEKVASAVTDGMEKQALKLDALTRMGHKAVSRGNALHFAKRLQQRNRALANPKNIASRNKQYHDAQAKLGDAAYLEQRYGMVGPNSRELARLQGRRIPNDSRTISDLTLVSPRNGGLQRAEELLNTRNVQASPSELGNVVHHLRTNFGALV